MLIIKYLGNEFIKEDSLAIEIAGKLQKRLSETMRFEKIATFDDLVFIKDCIYMDVCQGIEKAVLITDINAFERIRSSTAHDLDFGFFLKLSKELGEIDKVRIICLPQKRYPNIEEDVCRILGKLEESK